MLIEELRQIISAGETSKVKFKRSFDNQDKIAAEIIAFANAKGGMLLFGVEDKSGIITGLDFNDIRITGNKVATIANELVKPLVNIFSEVVEIDSKNILIVTVEEGIAKPYKDLNGTIWIKQGPDKRRLTENAEIVRLFQYNGMLYVDEMKVSNTGIKDIYEAKVTEYINKIRGEREDDAVKLTPELYIKFNTKTGSYEGTKRFAIYEA